MPILNPDHLLDQADRLIAPVGGGAPRQADLRRAVSNAYYALFHAVITQIADDLAGRVDRNSPRYALVYRSVDHKALRRLCEDVTKPNLPNKYSGYAPRAGFGADLTAVATAVVDLQEKRHLADYDPLYRVRASDAAIAVATSRNALLRLRSANRSYRRTFMSLIVFSPR